VYFKSCTVDVKRDDDGSSATPDIPNAKGNSTFLREYRPPHRLEKHAEEHGLRRRFWTVLSVWIRGCDCRRRQAFRLCDGNGAGFSLLSEHHTKEYFVVPVANDSSPAAIPMVK
jgi:hypothetical protein